MTLTGWTWNAPIDSKDLSMACCNVLCFEYLLSLYSNQQTLPVSFNDDVMSRGSNDSLFQLEREPLQATKEEEEQKEFVDRSFGSLSDEAFAGSSPIHRAMLLCLSKGPIVG